MPFTALSPFFTILVSIVFLSSCSLWFLCSSDLSGWLNRFFRTALVPSWLSLSVVFLGGVDSTTKSSGLGEWAGDEPAEDMMTSLLFLASVKFVCSVSLFWLVLWEFVSFVSSFCCSVCLLGDKPPILLFFAICLSFAKACGFIWRFRDDFGFWPPLSVTTTGSPMNYNSIITLAHCHFKDTSNKSHLDKVNTTHKNIPVQV